MTARLVVELSRLMALPAMLVARRERRRRPVQAPKGLVVGQLVASHRSFTAFSRTPSGLSGAQPCSVKAATTRDCLRQRERTLNPGHLVGGGRRPGRSATWESPHRCGCPRPATCCAATPVEAAEPSRVIRAWRLPGTSAPLPKRLSQGKVWNRGITFESGFLRKWHAAL